MRAAVSVEGARRPRPLPLGPVRPDGQGRSSAGRRNTHDAIESRAVGAHFPVLPADRQLPLLPQHGQERSCRATLRIPQPLLPEAEEGQGVMHMSKE